jgi:Phasin protein
MARKSRRTEGAGSGAPSENERLVTETGEETVPAVEKTAAPSGAAVRAAPENSVIVAAEEIQAEPGFHALPSGTDERGDGATVDPVTGIVEAALTDDFEVLQELGDESLRAAQSIASSYSGNFRMFAAEAANYSKTCAETRAAFAGALLSAKSLEKAIQLQNSYANSAYARFMAHLLKMNGLYWNLLGEAFKPVPQVHNNNIPRAEA